MVFVVVERSCVVLGRPSSHRPLGSSPAGTRAALRRRSSRSWSRRWPARCPSKSGSQFLTPTARCGARSRCQSRPTSFSGGWRRWPRPIPSFEIANPGRPPRSTTTTGSASSWPSATRATTRRRRRCSAASPPRMRGSASRTSRQRRTHSCAAHDIQPPVVGTSRLRTRRWSSCSATWRRTDSRTTSCPEAALSSCGRSPRTYSGSRLTG